MKPILLLVPGILAKDDQIHCRELWWAAKKQGFKVGTVLFRNAMGRHITSGKFHYGG